MARTARNFKIDTRSARLKLPYKKSGLWVTISKGQAFGYRKANGNKCGSWIARLIGEEGRKEEVIGSADDYLDADGDSILTYAQAQERARGWFKTQNNSGGTVNASSHTIKDAAEKYLETYKAGKTRGGGKGLREVISTIDTHISPELGDKKITKLKKKTIEDWRDKIAVTPPRLRSKKEGAPNFRKQDNTEDNIRRRRSTANRILTVLKAILNHAHEHSGVGNKDVWSGVKPFHEVDAPKVRWLNDDECRRLANASALDLRKLVTAALLTGARYGELAALKVSDFTAQGGSIYIAKSKSGKARYIHLTDEGIDFFQSEIDGKQHADLIFRRGTGAEWKSSDQSRPIQAASTAARIKPAIGFHILRHTYASRLAMKGVPMAVIAAQLGHADTRMTERHYAHLGPSYVAKTVRDAFSTLGLVEKPNIVSFQSSHNRKNK